MNVATMELTCANCGFRLVGSGFLSGITAAEADVSLVTEWDDDTAAFEPCVDAERQIEQIERSFGRDWKW